MVARKKEPKKRLRIKSTVGLDVVFEAPDRTRWRSGCEPFVSYARRRRRVQKASTTNVSMEATPDGSGTATAAAAV